MKRHKPRPQRRRHHAERNRGHTRRSRPRRNRSNRPTTATEFFALPDHEREQFEQVARIVSRMRDDGVSLRRAARDANTSPKTVIRLAGSAVRKGKQGRYVAASRDRLLRVIVIPMDNGTREIATRDSRQATQVSRYYHALRRFLRTGDASALRTFEGQQITTLGNERVALVTDVDAVKRLGNAGVLSFESLYARR